MNKRKKELTGLQQGFIPMLIRLKADCLKALTKAGFCWAAGLQAQLGLAPHCRLHQVWATHVHSGVLAKWAQDQNPGGQANHASDL